MKCPNDKMQNAIFLCQNHMHWHCLTITNGNNIYKKDMIPSLRVLSALEWNMTRQVVGRLHMSRIIRGFMNNLAAGFYH